MRPVSIGRRSVQSMDLAAFRVADLETDRLNAEGQPIFRHRYGLRALLARLRARFDRASAAAKPHAFARPSDRA